MLMEKTGSGGRQYAGGWKEDAADLYKVSSVHVSCYFRMVGFRFLGRMGG